MDIPVIMPPSPVIMPPIRMMVQRTSYSDNITVFFLNFSLLIRSISKYSYRSIIRCEIINLIGKVMEWKIEK